MRCRIPIPTFRARSPLRCRSAYWPRAKFASRSIEARSPTSPIGLHRLGVEAVAVCLLWSVLHPQHERRVGEILAARLPGVPVTLSHQLNPALREYRRAIAAALDASLKPLMNKYLAGLTHSMREAGFGGRILVLTSQGGMVDVEEVQRAPILAINSGPSMAPIAGARLAAADAANKDAIVFDTGGTTFDVSLVRNGRVPFTHETWLGRPFQSDLTGFPSVDVRSIGAGGGSIAWVEEGRVLRVGPQSAGAVPGPACYAAGGAHATVTDAALVLGYIDPSFFLGGRIRLDRDAAMAAVQRDVAAPFAHDARSGRERGHGGLVREHGAGHLGHHRQPGHRSGASRHRRRRRRCGSQCADDRGKARLRAARSSPRWARHSAHSARWCPTLRGNIAACSSPARRNSIGTAPRR